MTRSTKTIDEVMDIITGQLSNEVRSGLANFYDDKATRTAAATKTRTETKTTPDVSIALKTARELYRGR